MPRLIDADAAIDRYYAEYEKQDICDGGEDRDWLKRCIDEATTIEAEPVKHGRWLSDTGSWLLGRCSQCREIYSWDSLAGSNYCPNCGAKMDVTDTNVGNKGGEQK